VYWCWWGGLGGGGGGGGGGWWGGCVWGGVSVGGRVWLGGGGGGGDPKNDCPGVEGTQLMTKQPIRTQSFIGFQRAIWAEKKGNEG